MPCVGKSDMACQFRGPYVRRTDVSSRPTTRDPDSRRQGVVVVVLVVGDAQLSRRVRAGLRETPSQVRLAKDLDDAIDSLAEREIDVVVVDADADHPGAGVALVRALARGAGPWTGRVVVGVTEPDQAIDVLLPATAEPEALRDAILRVAREPRRLPSPI